MLKCMCLSYKLIQISFLEFELQMAHNHYVWMQNGETWFPTWNQALQY